MTLLPLPLMGLVLAGQPAHAFRHTFGVWDRAAFPLAWYMSDHVSDKLDPSYQVDVQVEAVGNWMNEAPCAKLETSYEGVREGHWETGASTSDGLNTVYYDDPASQNDESALGVTYMNFSTEIAFQARGGDPEDPEAELYYNYYYDTDIVYSDWVDWATTPDIAAGNCSNEYAIEATSTHEWGHALGMGHSCEQEEVESSVCQDRDLFDATMFWTGQPCDTSRTTLGEDDIDGITALYGPYATFSVVEEGPGSQQFGGVPLEVCFELQTTADTYEGLSVEWSFGDGDGSTEYNICHTYETQGQFTVALTVTGTDEACGDYSYQRREPAYVLACEPPHAAEGFDGAFTYEYVEGTTYQMVNQADTTVYGCIDQVQWDVFKGDELVQSVSAWSPKIDFGAEGSYEVVLNLGGPGGVAAETLTIEVGSEGGGCSTLPAAAGLFGAMAGLGALVRRRRRS